MSRYFQNIYDTLSTLLTGMSITWKHMVNIKRDNVTLQYPEERWPRPERNIGFEHKNYNVIRSRLHVDIDDCIVFLVHFFFLILFFFLQYLVSQHLVFLV